MAIVVGLTINATSSKRLIFYRLYWKMKPDNTDSLQMYKKFMWFKNNPYDNTQKINL